MKSIKFFSILLLAVMVAFASCKKDEINDTNVVPDPVNPGQVYSNGLIERSVTDEDGLTIGCVMLEYPFSMVLVDGSTVVIASEEGMNEAISDSTNYPIDFVYPVNVTLADGSAATANNAGELGALFAACIPDTGWGDSTIVEGGDFFPAWDISFDNSCIQLVYPVSIVSENGTPQTANSQDELIAYLADGNYYSFVFPVSFENVDGTVTSVANPDDLFDLLLACNPNGGVGGGCGISSFGCYQFAYPITLELEGGSTVVVNNDDEFNAAVLAGNLIGFGFPLTLTDADGNNVVVNNEAELEQALVNCGNVIDGDGPNLSGDFLCYDFVFPIQVIANGISTTIADEAAWQSFLSSGSNGDSLEFVFPLGIVHVETGATITVNNDSELSEAVQDCF